MEIQAKIDADEDAEGRYGAKPESRYMPGISFSRRC